jgi:hypothetical protein
MPHTLGRGKKVYPGDVRHGTRWATAEERSWAGLALDDLETNRNSIALMPAPHKNFEGHKVRVQQSANPAWYVRFGRSFWRSIRSFQLKRWRVEKALKRVAVVGIVRRNGYEVRLLPLLKEVLGGAQRAVAR